MDIGQNGGKQKQHLSYGPVLFVLIPCLLLCVVIVLGIVLFDEPLQSGWFPTSGEEGQEPALRGWVRATDNEVKSYNEWLTELWGSDEKSGGNIGDTPSMLYGFRKDDYPIFLIDVYEVFKNSLLAGLSGIPPIYGGMVLPEGGLPSTDGREENEDYINRVSDWFVGFEEKYQEGRYYNEATGEYDIERTTIIEMPIAQVVDLRHGGSAAHILFTFKAVYGDGAVDASFTDTIIIFGEDKLIEIVICGYDYDENSHKDEQIVDYIIDNYPNLDLSN